MRNEIPSELSTLLPQHKYSEPYKDQPRYQAILILLPACCVVNAIGVNAYVAAGWSGVRWDWEVLAACNAAVLMRMHDAFGMEFITNGPTRSAVLRVQAVNGARR